MRSRVPVAATERHLLEGALLPAGLSPPGIRLEVQADPGEAVGGARDQAQRATGQRDRRGDSEGGPRRERPRGLGPPAARAPRRRPRSKAGDAFEASFRGVATGTGQIARLEAAYSAETKSGRIAGSNPARVLVTGPVRAAWKPLFDVAGYREFARSTRTEWVIPSLPTRVAAVVGRRSRVPVELDESRRARGEGRAPRGGAGGRQGRGARGFHPARRRSSGFGAGARGGAFRPARRAATRPGCRWRSPWWARRRDRDRGRDEADLYVLPALVVPRVAPPPQIDGDLSDLQGFAQSAISPKDKWQRTEPSGPADLSAEFFVGYDLRYLYVGVRVHDEAVVCNISPLDIKAQLRSDAVGVTVDPSGKSQDTSTTFQAAAFPCTTNGFGARGFRDADARPGVMEETAPGMQVVSRKTADGLRDGVRPAVLGHARERRSRATRSGSTWCSTTAIRRTPVPAPTSTRAGSPGRPSSGAASRPCPISGDG